MTRYKRYVTYRTFPVTCPSSFYIVMEHARFGSLWTGLLVGRFHTEQSLELAGAAGGGALRGGSRTLWDVWGTIETLKEVADALM